MTDIDTSGGGYRVGAVVYHERVRHIWEGFETWFAEEGFPLQATYEESYETQVDNLLAGRLDAAWNTNLAHVLLQAQAGAARALVMRDTDLGWTSHLVVLADSDVVDVIDLRGRRVGFGDADSPQAHILPVHALRGLGVDPATVFHSTRLDRDLGKHGDTGGAELAQLARLRTGELDACVLSSVTLDAVRRLGDADGLRVVWTSPPFTHCTFSVLTDDPRHERFAELLLRMDASDPKLCEPMQMEMVNRWVRADTSGYRDLVAAVAAGPVLVGGG